MNPSRLLKNVITTFLRNTKLLHDSHIANYFEIIFCSATTWGILRYLYSSRTIFLCKCTLLTHYQVPGEVKPLRSDCVPMQGQPRPAAGLSRLPRTVGNKRERDFHSLTLPFNIFFCIFAGGMRQHSKTSWQTEASCSSLVI